MANIRYIESGAGEGNRTPVVSLGSVSNGAILPIFWRKRLDQSAPESRTFREHGGCLPQLYRTQNGPQQCWKHCAALAHEGAFA